MGARRPRFLRDLYLLSAVLTAISFLPAPADAGDIEYVIHLNLDGLHAKSVEVLGPEGAPNLWRLRTEGAYTDRARSDFDSTVTTPNHSSIFASRPIYDFTDTATTDYDGHLWGENSGDPLALADSIHHTHTFAPAKTSWEYVPSIYDVTHDAGLRTGLFNGKHRLNLHYESWHTYGRSLSATGESDPQVSKIDAHTHQQYSTGGGEETMFYDWYTEMSGADPMNYSYLHFAGTDVNGHATNWDMTPQSGYMEYIKAVDAHLGEIFALIESDPDLKDKTAIVMTTDHGGSLGTTGHGTKTDIDCYEISVYAWGPGVSAGADLYTLNTQYTNPGTTRPDHTDQANQPIRNGDTTNLVLSMLGLSAVPGSAYNADQSFTASYNYTTQAANDDPVRYYRMAETSGTIAVNSALHPGTPSDGDGTYSIAATGAGSLLATDASNGAAAFNGTSQGIVVPNHADVNTAASYTAKTIELWFDASGNVTDRQVLYEQGGASRGLNVYVVDGKVYVSGWNLSSDDATTPWGGTGASATAVSTDIAAGEKHHVVLVMKGDASGKDGSITGFLDGRAFGQIYGVGTLFAHSDPNAIGMQNGDSYYHDIGTWSGSGGTLHMTGTIDELGMYNAVLDTGRVQSHAAHGDGQRVSHGAYGDAVLHDSPVAYFQFGEVSGDGAVNAATDVTSGGFGVDNAVDGRHQTGTTINSPSLIVTGSDNGAAAYNGSTGGTKIPSHTSIDDGTQSMKTISLWFNANNVTDRQVLYEQGGTDHGLNVYVESGEVRVGAWSYGGATMFQNLGASVGTASSRNVILAFDSNSDAMVGMLDGEVIGAVRGVSALPGHTSGIGVGHMNGDSRFDNGAGGSTGESGDGRNFDGSIDDVAVFTGSLSMYQVRRQLAAAGVTPTEDAYEKAVQADNPMAYYRMNDTTGDGAANVSTNPGTLGNTVTGHVQGGIDRTAASLISGISDNSADFDGNTGTTLDVPDHKAINTTGNKKNQTIEFWFNADDVTSRQILYEQGGSSNGMNAYLEGGDLHCGIWNSSSKVQNHFVETAVSTGTTYHLMFVYNDSRDDSMTAYLNGVPVGGVNGVNTINAHTGDVGIGAMNNDTRVADGTADGLNQSGDGLNFDGRIDEFALYSYALTTQQAQTHYAVATGDRHGIPEGVELGVPLNYDASLDTDGDTNWEDTIGSRKNGGAANVFDFVLTDVTRGATTSAHPGITHAYTFGGSTVSGGKTESFEDVAANPTNQNASFEMWVRPGDLTDLDLLFETGGSTDGTSIVLDGSEVKFTVLDGGTGGLSSQSTFDLTDLTPAERAEFIQIIGVINLKEDYTRLYINGLLRDEQGTTGTGSNFADWAGSDNSGLGILNGSTSFGGGTLTTFEGEMAVFRFYDYALDWVEIGDNYEGVSGVNVPEPGSLCLLGLGALALLRRRRVRRRR